MSSQFGSGGWEEPLPKTSLLAGAGITVSGSSPQTVSLSSPTLQGTYDAQMQGAGILAEAYPLTVAGGSAIGAVGANNTLFMSAVGLLAGMTVGHLIIPLSGAGVTNTLDKLALFDKTGVLLAVTADFSGTIVVNWNYIPLSVPASYTVTVTDLYYVGFLCRATGTIPAGYRPGSANLLGLPPDGASPRRAAQVATQTDIAGNVTPANTSSWLYMAAAV